MRFINGCHQKSHADPVWFWTPDSSGRPSSIQEAPVPVSLLKRSSAGVIWMWVAFFSRSSLGCLAWLTTVVPSKAVYWIPCSCGKAYISETRRRLKEHQDACQKGTVEKSQSQNMHGKTTTPSNGMRQQWLAMPDISKNQYHFMQAPTEKPPLHSLLYMFMFAGLRSTVLTLFRLC